MLGGVVAVGTDWVASLAVGAEDRGVAVQTRKVVDAAPGLLLVCTVEHVVGLVGGVHHIAPKDSGSNLERLARTVLVGKIRDTYLLSQMKRYCQGQVRQTCIHLVLPRHHQQHGRPQSSR